MPVYGKVEAFEGKGTDWPLYLEQLEQYFAANALTDAEQQKSIFLASCGMRTYALLRKLTAPHKPKDKSLEELTALLTKYFTPTPNIIVERCNFFSRSRHEGESVATFIAELRSLSEHCAFGAVLEDMLRDRLVCGINKVSIQERLFSEPDLTLQRAEELALAMEAASRDVTNIRHYGQPGGASEAENHISQEVHHMTLGKIQKQGGKSNYIKGKSNVCCYRCGEEHYANECKHKATRCHICRKVGHLAKVCKSGPSSEADQEKKVGTKNIPKRTNVVEVYTDEEEVYEMNSVESGHNPPVHITVIFNGKNLLMELDCGAAISVINRDKYEELWGNEGTLPLQATRVKLRSYCGNIIRACGQVTALAEYGGVKAKVTLCVVPGSGPMLLGRNWMHSLQIVPELFDLHKIQLVGLQEVLNNHKEVFSGGLGTMKGVTASIVVPKDAQPKFFKCRPVPFALKNKIESELDRLVADKVLVPVKYAKWAAPIVPIIKDDGTVRITGDFKITVNPVSSLEQYPVPRIEELFAKLSGGKKFTKLDLRDAYLQMLLEDASKEFVTINTTKGLFQYLRLPPGVSSAPAIFLKAMDGLMGDIDRLAMFFDDFLVTGKDDEEHLKNLQEVLARLQGAGLKLKKEKCAFMQEEIEYLGYKLDAKGLHPTHNKVEAIHKARAPICVKELQSYLGLLNHYRRFLPNLSEVLTPLHNLLQSGVEWQWTPVEEDAFKNSKDLLVSDALLVYFDPEKPIIVSCDASPYGVGAVLSHRFTDGSERPVGYVSRSLSKAEKNYSQLDKEALALIFAVTKFHQYLFGFKFELQTDHEPLLGLFQRGKAVPMQSSPRIIRWALKLAAYEYKLVYKPGRKNGNADALSRLPLPVYSEFNSKPAETFMLENEYPQLLSAKVIAKFTNRDPVLAEVRRLLWAGDKLPIELKGYASRQNELSIQGSCVLWGARVVIPGQLRTQVLALLHEGHPGMSRMKSIARSHVWWPRMDADIEILVQTCGSCQANRHDAPRVAMQPWPFPSKPWSRLHIDHAGPFQGKLFFIVVDAYSKWVEVHKVPSTAAGTTIVCLRTIFATHGLPDLIVSDNGPGFDNVQFKAFLKSNGIKYLAVPPYHPSSNGAAERVVQTVKAKLKLCTGGEDWSTRLARFLLHYRSQQHETTGASPAELLNNRKLKTLLSCLHPELDTEVRVKQLKSKVRQDVRSQGREFQIGDSVFARNFREGRKWVPGVVEDMIGPVVFVVRVGVGQWRRHADHLRKRVDGEWDHGDREQFMPATGDLPLKKNGDWEQVVAGPNTETMQVEGRSNHQEPGNEGETMGKEPEKGSEVVTNEPRKELPVSEVRRSGRKIKAPDKLNL